MTDEERIELIAQIALVGFQAMNHYVRKLKLSEDEKILVCGAACDVLHEMVPAADAATGFVR